MIKRILALLALTLLANAAQASWREARSKHFVVYGDVGERQLRDFTAKLEKYDSVLRLLWDVPEGADAIPLTVLLVPNEKTVQKLGGPSLKYAAGFYRGGSSGSYFVAARDFGGGTSAFDAQMEDLLYHEYAHHFMMQYFSSTYPAWYVEGFAEVVSTVDYNGKGQVLFGQPAMSRLPGLARIKPLPIERILTGGLEGLKIDEIESFYGRSWLLVHYLSFAKPRADQMKTYLAAVGSGKSFAEASKVFGDPRILDRELNKYFKDYKFAYRILDVAVPDPDAFTIRDLTPAESALAFERLQFVSGIDASTADEFAGKIEAVAKQYPNDPFVLQLLAAARFAIQDYPGTEKAADALLAVSPGNSRALLSKGMARIRLVSEMNDPKPADWKEARSWIVKANRADENNPLAYVEYYNSFREAGQKPPELALDGLIRALQLAPQDQGLRMNAAIQLASFGRFEEAAIIIKPIAYSPHQNSFSRAAKFFFDSFAKNEMPSSPPPEEGQSEGEGSPQPGFLNR